MRHICGMQPGISGAGRSMRRLQIEDTGALLMAIQQEIERSEDARYYHRLHGLLLLAAGHSCGQVAEVFGADDTTVQRWVRRFEEGGFEGCVKGGNPVDRAR